MREQWLAVEHSRLHQAERWPEGPRRDAQIAAVRSAISALSQGGQAPVFDCLTCREQRRNLTVFPVPTNSKLDLAA